MCPAHLLFYRITSFTHSEENHMDREILSCVNTDLDHDLDNSYRDIVWIAMSAPNNNDRTMKKNVTPFVILNNECPV